MSLKTEIYIAKLKGKELSPQMIPSKKYKHWISIADPDRCLDCKKNQGKIFFLFETPIPYPPLHPKCRCKIEKMNSIFAGTATINGTYGADLTLQRDGVLPAYYITKR